MDVQLTEAELQAAHEWQAARDAVEAVAAEMRAASMWHSRALWIANCERIAALRRLHEACGQAPERIRAAKAAAAVGAPLPLR